MPDITMCRNQDCPKCNSCYRYLAKPGYYQSYFAFETEEERKEFIDNCGHYWKVK